MKLRIPMIRLLCVLVLMSGAVLSHEPKKDWLIGTWVLCEDPDNSPKDSLLFNPDGTGAMVAAKGSLEFSHKYGRQMSPLPPSALPLPKGFPLDPIDAAGNALVAGSLVRILVIPDWLVHDLPSEEVCQLKACEGALMRVREMDEAGFVWFGGDHSWFRLRPSEVLLEVAQPQDI